MAAPAALASSAIEDREEVLPVAQVTEDRLAQKTASRHVEERTGELDTEGTRHALRMPVSS
jgi:hypothetical protein